MFKVTVWGARNRTCKKPKTAMSWVIFHINNIVRIDYVDPDGREYWWDFPELDGPESKMRHRLQFRHFAQWLAREFGYDRSELIPKEAA